MSVLESWTEAEKSMTWYPWGSPVALGLFLMLIGGFALPLHEGRIER